MFDVILAVYGYIVAQTRIREPETRVLRRNPLPSSGHFEKQKPDRWGRVLDFAGATGLEPATYCVTGSRSNQLSYAPIVSCVVSTP